MLKKMEKVTHNAPYKAHTIKIMMLCMVLVMSIQLISAEMSFDNTYEFDDDPKWGEYGKVTIKDWFGLLSLQEIELKTNTEICGSVECKAVKEIVMHQRGSLIEGVRFIDLKTGEYVKIKDYQIYIDDGVKLIPYNLGEEVNAETYDVVLKGELKPYQRVDWQIKVQGFWIEDWAVWESHLNTMLKLYYPFNENTGVKAVETSNGTYNLTVLDTWDDSGLLGSSYNTTNQQLANTSYRPNTQGGTDNQTINFWIKRTGSWANMNQHPIYTINNSPGGNGKNFLGMRAATHNLVWNLEDNVGGKTITDFYEVPLDTWVMITTVTNSSNATVYVNGVRNDSVALTNWIVGGEALLLFGDLVSFNITNASIDEFGYWHRMLNSSAITQLYNGGVGISQANQLISTLVSPADGSTTTSQDVTFNCSSNGIANPLKNVTFYHNGTGVFHANQTRAITGQTNSSNFTSNFSFGTYEWNCYTCDTAHDCVLASSNFTFTRDKVSIDTEFWNNATIEGASETFYINVTADSSVQISTGVLRYNNTNHAGTFVKTGNLYEFQSTIGVDAVIADSNLTFNWTLTLDDASTKVSDDNNQSVLSLSIDDCTANTVRILNYTLRDEDNQTFLGGVSQNTLVDVDIDIFTKGTTDQVLSFSSNFTQDNPIGICLNINLSNTEYSLDAVAKYQSTGRAVEHHHFQNHTLTNKTVPQNVTLFDLNSSKSQAFKITFKDENFIPLANALIDIQREYPEDGLFKSVEIPKTDLSGRTVGHLVKDDIKYNFIVTKNNQVLATFTNLIAFCEDIIAEDCFIDLVASQTGSTETDWLNFEGLTITQFDLNQITRVVTVIFTTTDGSSQTINLNVTKYDRWTNETVCSDTLTSSSGTLTCTIAPSFGNVTVIATLSKVGGSIVEQKVFRIFPDSDDYNEGSLIVLMIMLIVTIPLLFVSSTIGIVLGVIIGVILMGALTLYTGFSWWGTGSSIIFIIAAGIAIIWRISERSKS